MRRRVTMVLASAALAGSLVATNAQAHGGGGGGRTGGFAGGRIGVFAGGRIATFAGLRDVVRGALSDYGPGCQYYTSYNLPYNCTYSGQTNTSATQSAP